MLQRGEVLGGMYRIIQEIGRGGTGIIYLAEHLRLQKKVVVKKIRDNFAGQVNGRAEVDILKRLHHTCLPQVYDFLVIDSSIYTVMEYVEGNDLQQYLDQGYQFPEPLVRKWLLQMSEVLEYLHGQNPPILHSDIKPANIMVTAQGNLCLIDFNISIDGENTKDIQGISPWYSAPEQYEKAQDIRFGRTDRIVLDGRMDLYSLGAVFYRMMTGCLPPGEGQQAPEIMDMEIPYSDGIKAVVSKAMRKNVSMRFQTAGQMTRALQDIGRMDPLFKRYSRLQWGGTLIWILCVLAGVLLLYYGNWQRNTENWQEAYRELYLASEAGDETEIVSRGTAMLNDFSYQRYMEKNPGKKAEILHVVGDSYFRREDYDQAAEYYDEAWTLKPDAKNYGMDYLIALVRDDQITRADWLLENSGQGSGDFSEDEKLMIRAEIAWMREDSEKALECLEQLRETSVDAEILVSGYYLQSEILETQNRYGDAVTVLEEAKKLTADKEVFRRLGQAAVRAASDTDREVNADAYLHKALECYAILNQSDNPSYEDRLNYALVERASGKYEDSNTVLLRLAEEHEDNYELPMWICFNYLDIAREKGSYEDVINDLRFRYEECRHIYDISGEKNEDMEQLIVLMQELEEQK